jgi:hypothetical protein
MDGQRLQLLPDGLPDQLRSVLDDAVVKKVSVRAKSIFWLINHHFRQQNSIDDYN